MYVKLNRVNSFLKRLELIPDLTYSKSKSLTKCYHNFILNSYSKDDGTVYVGVIPNWKYECRDDKNIILEYNPNKINPFLMPQLAWLCHFPKSAIKVMTFDLAVDIKLDYSLVRMLKRDKREKFAIFGASGVETRYLGAMGHNHVKLYNKAKEQKVENVDWTRFEITLKEINSFSINFQEFKEKIKLPMLYSVNVQINSEYALLNDTTTLVLESIVDDVNRLYTINNYNTRKKYVDLLSKFLSPIDIDIGKMYKIFVEFGLYFNNSDEISKNVNYISILKNSH